MRDWTLGSGDPLALTLVADFRLCTPDYANDHIWELETGGGDPPSLSLHTTYGLRARSMRLFPRFTRNNKSVTEPAAFPIQPRLRQFCPNFLSLDFSPLPDIDVVAEYWVPESHAVAGRFTITNLGSKPDKLLLEFCGQLTPLEGQGFVPLPLQSTNILVGTCANLVPVIFLTGGSRPGPGPYPSLAIDLSLAAGESRTLTWAQAALTNQKESFELARHVAALPWEAERAKIDLVNSAQTVEIYTGNPDWDAAFALSQKIAFGLFFGSSQNFPHPSFMLTRQPDQGYSPRGDGSDYSQLWSGQQVLESYFLANLLPGAPGLTSGLVRNFLTAQAEDGSIDWKPGVAGQRGRWLAAPLLASLALKTFMKTHDRSFLREIQSGLESFSRSWFNETHDRDADGFPEWDHPLQAGVDDSPAFTLWQTGGLGAEISTAESPALAALLFREARALSKIAGILGQSKSQAKWRLESERMGFLVEDCWNAAAAMYHLRDRDTHFSPEGKSLGTFSGPGTFTLGQTFQQPLRLLLRLEMNGETTRRLKITLRGKNGKKLLSETLGRLDFQWGPELAVTTTQGVFTSLKEIVVEGVDTIDRVSVSVMDFSAEDITLFLPLWAGILSQSRAQEIVNQALLAKGRFSRSFGIPFCANSAAGDLAVTSMCIHVPWNAFVIEGLVGYGLRAEAVRLIMQVMEAIIQNLKRQHAFYRVYHSESGAGMGESNHVAGLAPTDLFLEILGVQIESPKRVTLSGMNPFPWPVTVKYRGLTVTRSAHQTNVFFPDSQTVTLDDPTDAVVSVE
jgi:hypothetical protein